MEILLEGNLPLFKLLIITFSVKVDREAGFHIDLEDYLMGLLQLASELVGKLHILKYNINCLQVFLVFFLAFAFCRFCMVIWVYHPRHNGQ